MVSGLALHFFSIDGDAGAALSKDNPRTNRSGEIGKRDCPCIVLTGLGYDKIMDENATKALTELRYQVEEAPEVYKEKVPMTYERKRTLMEARRTLKKERRRIVEGKK